MIVGSRIVNINKMEKQEIINLLESGLDYYFEGLPDEKYEIEVANGHLRLLEKVKDNEKSYNRVLSRFNKVTNNNVCYEFLVGGVYTVEEVETCFVKDELEEVKWHLEKMYTKEQILDSLARIIVDKNMNFTK